MARTLLTEAVFIVVVQFDIMKLRTIVVEYI
jgi:hypothetical protein